MAEERLLTVRDASVILSISEKEVLNLVESGRLPAYKVGGVYLRFKRQQIEDFRVSLKPLDQKYVSPQKVSFNDRVSDFFYFYDFYLLSILAIILILVFIFNY